MSTELDDIDEAVTDEELPESALDATWLGELTAKHGRLTILEAGGREWVVRRPKLAECDRYQDACDVPGASKAVALRQLARVCLLPATRDTTLEAERTAFTALAEESPSDARVIGLTVYTLSAGEKGVTAKKAPRSSNAPAKSQS